MKYTADSCSFKLLSISILFLHSSLVTNAGRILAIFPHFGASHWYSFRPMVEELAQRGHEVTVLSAFPRKTPLKNYRDISLVEAYPKTAEYVDFTQMEESSRISLQEIIPLYKMAKMTEATLQLPQVLALAEEKFDLIIVELFNTEIYHALTHKIGAPVMAISSHQLMGWSSYVALSPDEPSYVAHSHSNLAPPMDFLQRLTNFVELIIFKLAYRYMFIPAAQETAERQMGPLPDLYTVGQNVTMVLLNVHFTINNLRPHPPNVIEVGGLNVVPAKPLQKDLQQLLDNSKNGVIYFSMGTVLKASTLSENKRNAFLKTFAGLKQTVLWKLDGDLEGRPANVHISPWYPQRDIFAHKNVVLFISHCGNLGVNEAVHEGIPIICIPMFGDQPYNAKSVESQGMAAILDFYSDLTYEKIRSTVNLLLNNPSYKRNAQRVSKAYRDRPMTPLQTAVFWVEYVMRHDGAPHMRSPARHMPWYAYYNYDVLLLLHLAAFAVFYTVYRLLKFVCCSLICAKSSTQSAKNAASKPNKTNKYKKS